MCTTLVSVAGDRITFTERTAPRSGLRRLASLALTLLVLVAAPSPARAQCGADPGNDDFASATQLPGCGSTSASIDCLADYDYYAFTAPSSGPYTFETTGSTDTHLYLYDSNGDLITDDDDSGSGTNAKISYSLTSGVSYYVLVVEHGFDATGDYTLVVSGCSSGGCGNDPGNDYLGSATPLSGCGSTQAAIDCVGDLDYYWLTAPNSGSFTFETTGSTDTQLRLYDANGDAIANDDDSGDGSNAKIVYTLTAGQKYSVAVNEYNNDGTGDYTLVVSGCSGGGCGSDPGNDTTATATSLGSSCGTTSARIDCTGDVDFYAFTTPNSGTFTFDVNSLNAYNITLYSDAGSLLEGPAGSALSHTLSAGQLVYVRVMAASDGALLDYALVISGCSSGGCGSDPGNDYLGSATPLAGCGSTQAAIDCAGDLDYYWLTAPNSGSFTFETTGSTDTELRLYDANGDAIANDDDSGDGSNAKIVYTLTAGQKYSVAVNEYNNDGTGDYTLVISGCSSGGCGSDPGNDTTATATNLGSSCGTTSARIDCTGDVDFYAFTAPNSGTFTFDVSSLNAYNITLYSDAGSLLEGPGGSALSHTLSAGQLIYVRAMAASDGALLDYALVISGCSSGGCGNDPGNDDLGSATNLGSSCGTTSAAIDCAGDADFYRFTAPTAATYTFAVGSTGAMKLDFYNAGGQLVGSTTSSTTASMTAGEIVYVMAAAQSANDTPSYDLTISGCSGGGCGNDPGNDDFASATALSGCGTIQAALDCAGDEDYYRFMPLADGDFTIQLTASFSAGFTVFDGSHNQLGQSSTSLALHLKAADGPFFVDVASGLDLTGSYSMTLSGCSSGGCGSDPGNEDSDHATPLGNDSGTWPAAIDCTGDQDVYSFTASQTGSYTVTTTGSVPTLVQVFHGQTIDGRDDNTDGDTTASVTVTLNAGTKYFVGVASSSSGTGAYQLAITAPQGGTTTYSYLVPASAKVLGLSGTDWRSDLSIVNTAAASAKVTIEAWLRDRANPNPTAVTRVLAAGEAFNKTDLLSSLFGFGSGAAAALRITSDQELAISTRTYNYTANGTYGQYIRGRDVASSFQVGETAYLQGFREDATARSNLGLVNLAKVTNRITATFYAADGSQIGAPATYEVPAQGFIQKTRVLKTITSQPVSLAWAKLTAADGPFVGYLSLIDAASGDPTFRPTMAAWGSNAEVILPGIAKVHGAAGTNWISDMVLLNTTATTQQVGVELWIRNDPNSSPQTRSLTLAAHECRLLADVLPGLFGVTSGAAAFKISVGPGVIVDARTFNQVSAGSYGQYVPAMYRLQGVFSTLPGYFPMVTQNAAFRTNLGLVNGASGAVQVKISLYDATGTMVGSTITVDLADKAVTQIDRIVNRFTSASFSGGYLKLEVPSTTTDHPVHAFVTVVDQKTGDPVYQTPVTIQP